MTLRPYAAKAIVEHELRTTQLWLYVTFRFPMDENAMPPLGLWIPKVDDANKVVIFSGWLDAYTLRLLIINIVVRPNRVQLSYDGPDPNLRTTWLKQWEPWAEITSTEFTPIYSTRTFSTGPAPQDNVNVLNVNILFIDCAANDVVIGGLIGGVNGQVLQIVRSCASVNNVTLEHNEGTANQNLFLHAGADETLTSEYGGWTLACNGTSWFDVSHAKHV